MSKKEDEVSLDCQDLLDCYGLPNWRNNVLHGKFKGFKEKVYRIVKTGCKGLSDRQALLTDGSGRTLYVEVKREKGGRQSEDQKSFEMNCERNNIPYILVSSAIDLEEYLQILGFRRVK